MPRWASRITLDVTDVWVERIQEIDDDGAMREGMTATDGGVLSIRRHEFIALWNRLQDKRGFGWDTNPWVWVLTFRKVAR